MYWVRHIVPASFILTELHVYMLIKLKEIYNSIKWNQNVISNKNFSIYISDESKRRTQSYCEDCEIWYMGKHTCVQAGSLVLNQFFSIS